MATKTGRVFGGVFRKNMSRSPSRLVQRYTRFSRSVLKHWRNNYLKIECYKLNSCLRPFDKDYAPILLVNTLK
jgi:hypothetical protein